MGGSPTRSSCHHEAAVGRAWLISSCPHSVPASGSLRKNSLFSFSIQDPERGTRGWGGSGGGGSLLPLFLSCLGSPLAPNLRRLLAGELEILARTGGGRGSVSQALLLLWGEQGGRSGEGMLRETVGHGVTCPQLMGWQFDSHFHKLYFMSKCTEILWPLFLCPSPSWPPPPRPLPGVCLGPVSVPEAQEGHLEAALA